MAASDTRPVIIVGGGLAGLVAAFELSKRNVKTVIVDQENEANLGGQAFWSLGGVFCVNSANQRWLGVRDSRELALQDWLNTARFDRDTADRWPRRWARAFVDFATDQLEPYLKARGVGFTTVGWAERGDGSADGHGNSVPRFHVAWGAGPAIMEAFEKPVREASTKGLVEFKFRHQVDALCVDKRSGAAVGVRGRVLEPSETARGEESSRHAVDDFELRGRAVLIATGGIGGNVDLVKENWPVDRLGRAPSSVVIGVPAHVDGRMIGIARDAGANVINSDRMWHYTEGLDNWNSIWPQHGIRVLAGPSSLWLDATGKRLPPFLYPGSDTLATLRYIGHTGYDYTWFVLNKTIVAREFSLSGSEQNPDLTNKSYWMLLQRLFGSAMPGPVQKFVENGSDFVVAPSLSELVAGMNKLAHDREGPQLDVDQVQRELEQRDLQVDNAYTKDAQVMLMRNARNFWPDRLRSVTKPHKILDPRHGPLVAVRMNILTRKTLGGIETDLQANVIRPDGSLFPGLYAAGEAAGFGGGGVHGYSALEGTFLGGCIFSGRAAGMKMAEEAAEIPARSSL